MNKMLIVSLCLALSFLSSCAPVAHPTIAPAVQVSVAATQNLIPTNEAEPDPTPTALPDMITARTIDDYRVIPADLDPASQPEQVASEYLAAINDDGQHLRWYLSADRSGGITFQLVLEPLLTDPTSSIALRYPLQVSVALSEFSPNRINTILPTSGGGGGPSNFFPPFYIHVGNFQIQPNDPILEEFNAEYWMIKQDLIFLCTEPGVYNIQIDQPYTVTSNGVTSDKLLTYQTLVACPATFSEWFLDSMTLDMGLVDQYLFTNEQQYIPAP